MPKILWLASHPGNPTKQLLNHLEGETVKVQALCCKSYLVRPVF